MIDPEFLSNISALLGSCLLAFVSTFFCIKWLSHPAAKFGLFDHPGGRKQHPKPVLIIGGFSMFLGLIFSALTLDTSLMPYRSLFAGGGLLTLVGLLDDMHELKSSSRLVAQLIAACLMAFWGGVLLKDFGDFFTLGNLYLGKWGVFLTVIAVMGLINAVNMLDGVDGLAGSLSFIQVILLSYLAFKAGRVGDLKILILIASVLFAFLWFNFPKGKQGAEVFMGDAGSMWLGFVLTWFCVSLSQEPHVAANPVTFVWIMAVPIFDMLRVIVYRIRRGQSPFHADRQHFHHILHAAGFNALQTTLVLSGLGLALGLVGLVFNHFVVRGYISILILLALFALYCVTFSFLNNRSLKIDSKTN